MAESKKEAEKRLREEKIQLLRQKQGLEEASAEKEEKAPLTKREKAANFWYYHKWKVILGLVLIIAACGIIYSVVTAVRPDYSVMILSLEHENFGTKTEEISAWFEQYGEDVNGDGRIYVQTIYAPVGNSELHPNDVQAFYANQTALMAEFQVCRTAFFIVDAEAEEQTGILEHLKDFTKEYPDSGAVVRGGLLVSETDMAKKIGALKLPDGAYIGIREYTEDAYDSKELYKSTSEGMVLMERLLQEFGK